MAKGSDCSTCAKRAAARKAALAAATAGIAHPKYDVRLGDELLDSFSTVTGAAALVKAHPGATIHLVEA